MVKTYALEAVIVKKNEMVMVDIYLLYVVEVEVEVYKH